MKATCYVCGKETEKERVRSGKHICVSCSKKRRKDYYLRRKGSKHDS